MPENESGITFLRIPNEIFNCGCRSHAVKTLYNP